MKTMLIANRGEISVRIQRAAAAAGVDAVAVYATDDAASAHVADAPRAVRLGAAGPNAYMDIEAMLRVAITTGCDAIHPGYGMLSERADFAEACGAAGLTFVGPPAEVLALFGDKERAHAFAADCNLPVPRAIGGSASLEEVAAFYRSTPSGVMLKSVYGGGGRGLRVVRDEAELPRALARARSEGAGAFGSPELYIEELLEPVRHVEVQLLGDATGAVVSLGVRDCSLQRRNQKIVEVAPAPGLGGDTVKALETAAVHLGQQAGLVNLATVEFLVQPGGGAGDWRFIEVNPRLQVEHTITEAITGLDLVGTQLAVADGATLADLGLADGSVATGAALQLRVNAERVESDGEVWPSTGTVTRFEVPADESVRVDTHIRAGDRVTGTFDSLLAKLVVHDRAGDIDRLLQIAVDVAARCEIGGVETNLDVLRALLVRPRPENGWWPTRSVDAFLTEWGADLETASNSALPGAGAVGHRKSGEGEHWTNAPIQGVVVELLADVGDKVAAGDEVVILEAMKMEHALRAPAAGTVTRLEVGVGDQVWQGDRLFAVDATEGTVSTAADVVGGDVAGGVRSDLAEVQQRHALGQDEQRPDAVSRRRAAGLRTVRENLADLVDPGSFVEYAPLAIAAQRQRRSHDDLVRNTPADGMVTGTASVNGELFGDEAAQCVVLAYDWTVLAGTQGMVNHRKKDRMFALARDAGLPMVVFGEGGGGRPGDTDGFIGLDNMTFVDFGMLKGRVPLVGVVAGKSFAGHAALMGVCDVIIAAKGTTMGMGGPVMIEGAGLGSFPPEEVGPLDVHTATGVVDVVAEDEADAVATAKQYLGYFQGATDEWACDDQAPLRHVVPASRKRAYDPREVITRIADVGSCLELRPTFGRSMVTMLARIGGRPVGVVANDPRHDAGAITSDAADKAARFWQSCDTFGLPIVSLCDTPGIMVGPEAEQTALVRHSSRMFVVGARLRVPIFTVVLRRAYGLGAMAMAGGSLKAARFTVAWPTGEFGPMGLEGSVHLAYRRELEAIEDPNERDAFFEARLAEMYEQGKALTSAELFEIDDVIDPADTRRWLAAGLRVHAPRTSKRRPDGYLDTW